MAGWWPVGRLMCLAGAVARRLSWGTMGPSCVPGGPRAVACGAGLWGWQAQGSGQAGTDRHKTRQSLLWSMPVSLRCARGAAASSLLEPSVGLRVGGGGLLGPYGGGLPGGHVQRGARGGRHVDLQEELVGVQRFGAADLHIVQGGRVGEEDDRLVREGRGQEVKDGPRRG